MKLYFKAAMQGLAGLGLLFVLSGCAGVADLKPATEAPSTVAPTNVASTNVAPTTVASSTASPTASATTSPTISPTDRPAAPAQPEVTAPSVPQSAEPLPTGAAVFAADPALPAMAANWQPVPMSSLPNWAGDPLTDAWPALQANCKRMGARAPWQSFCAAVSASLPISPAAARALLTQHLQAYALQLDTKTPAVGVATGYFEPIYAGALSRGGIYQWPVYSSPPSPFALLSRAEITPVGREPHPAVRGRELAWLSNPIDAFLAQVQGSARITLPDGSTKRLAYAAKNGQPYVSIANTLVAQGVFTLPQASMERIRTWAAGQAAGGNVNAIQSVLNTNPSFVFFRWGEDVSADQATVGPVGALGVPLTALRSVAIDPAHTPLGTPIWLETRIGAGVSSNLPFSQLMLAQDTGSAIKGAARVDIYFGTGDAAGALAGRQKYPSRVWVLWPKTKP